MKYILENLKEAYDDFHLYDYSPDYVVDYAIQCLDRLNTLVESNFPDSVVKREFLSVLYKICSFKSYFKVDENSDSDCIEISFEYVRGNRYEEGRTSYFGGVSFYFYDGKIDDIAFHYSGGFQREYYDYSGRHMVESRDDNTGVSYSAVFARGEFSRICSKSGVATFRNHDCFKNTSSLYYR